MEYTPEAIEALTVNEVEIMKKIAAELEIRMSQVSAVISLVNEGCTIPFISRYRKERHDNLNEVQVRDCDHLFKSYKNLEETRIDYIKKIYAQGKLTETLAAALSSAQTLTALDDLYAPFKKKKKTRGMAAIERGLEPLADFMLGANNDSAVEAEAAKYVKTDCQDEALNVPSVEDALDGAKDVIAERVSQETQNREVIHDLYMRTGLIKTKGIVPEGTDPSVAENTSTYKMYWDFEEPLNQVKPHRILAINRAEREGALDVTIDVDVDTAVKTLQRKADIHNKYHEEAIEDGVVRLLSPAVVREIRSDETDAADEHGIELFSENLKNLLMTQPIKGSRVLGIDPGIRTGTKCAALDETGKYLGYFKIFQVQNPEDAYKQLNDAIDKYDIQVVAVGNGTGSQEVQAVVSKVITENYKDSDVMYTVVDESGASVYSASEVATKEFPELDLTIRGAISMGRRLQDPLAELVKIDPKAIGVGLYQHDVNQKKLSDTLDEVVGSVVNNVGVNLNTASYMLLSYVSGITMSTAKKIVDFRDKNGKILSRESLKEVPGLGPKAFEQCAGFLKIPESSDPLDNTWVHPENYEVAREILPKVQAKEKIGNDMLKALCEKYNLGLQTVTDIVDELQKPNRDPRDGMPAPIMQKGVLEFEDLKEGMKVTGKIKNVVDFGAFVDIGIHDTALVHVSELSDSFIENPMDVIKVGDIKEFVIIDLDKDRHRIGLSLKSDAMSRIGQGGTQGKRSSSSGERPVSGAAHPAGSNSSGRKVVVVKKKDANPGKNGYNKLNNSKISNSGSRRYEPADSGESYNPFAGL